MMNPTILFLAVIAAGGAFLLIDGVFGLIPRHRATGGLEAGARARGSVEVDEQIRLTIMDDAPPLADRLLTPIFQDLGRSLSDEKKDEIEDLLRRSGWKYKTVGDYYATRVGLAAILFIGGAGFLIVSGEPFFFVAPFALGVLGYFIPPREVQSAIKERSQQVLTEMAFSLDRLSLLLKAGIALSEAIGTLAETEGGPFLAALRRVARRLGAGGVRDLEDALDEFQRDLPRDPEVQQFVNRLRVGFSGTPVAESLGVQADRLQAAMNTRLLRRGLETVLIITTVGAAFMLPALGLLILGPPLMLAFNIL